MAAISHWKREIEMATTKLYKKHLSEDGKTTDVAEHLADDRQVALLLEHGYFKTKTAAEKVTKAQLEEAIKPVTTTEADTASTTV